MTADVVDQIVALRRVATAVGSPAERHRLARVIRGLRRNLGVGVPKRRAAGVLGVSVQALDRWIAKGAIPTVRRPGSSRELIDTEALLVLAEETARLRDRGERHPLAKALGEITARGALPTRLRPNDTSRQLRYEYLHSSPAARLRQGIELSHLAAALARAKAER